MDQLSNGRTVLGICSGMTNPEFQGFKHLSNMITIPADARMIRHARGKGLPQEHYFKWCAWIKAMLLIPAGFGPTRFALCVCIPETQELRICSGMRHVGAGAFGLRLMDKDQQVFFIGERQVALRPGGIFGGMEQSARQLPKTADLY